SNPSRLAAPAGPFILLCRRAVFRSLDHRLPWPVARLFLRPAYRARCRTLAGGAGDRSRRRGIAADYFLFRRRPDGLARAGTARDRTVHGAGGDAARRTRERGA